MYASRKNFFPSEEAARYSSIQCPHDICYEREALSDCGRMGDGKSTKEACGIPSLSQDARTHYCAHAYAHTYAHAQSQACAFHEHANDSCQQNARSIENICGAASTPIRIQEACGIPLQSGCMNALLYARTCTHICTCARPRLLRLRALVVPFAHI